MNTDTLTPDPAAPVIDGRPVRAGTGRRLRWRAGRLLRSRIEREEAELERRLRSPPALTRPTVVAVASARRGVGATTGTFVLGNLLASHLKLRAIAVDARPVGDLARVSPARRRAQRSFDELLEDLGRLHTAAQLNRYVSRLATGLHVLAAPRDGAPESRLDRDRCGELVAFLSCFYEVVLLDVGTGVRGALGELAIQRADQLVLVTTPELLAAHVTRQALSPIASERATVVINKSWLRPAEVEVVEHGFRAKHRHRPITLPYDEQLAGMLHSATYALDALRVRPRLAIKRLGLAVAERLV